MTHAAAGVESTWQGVSHGGGDTLWAQEHAPCSQVQALAKERSCTQAMAIVRRVMHQRLFCPLHDSHQAHSRGSPFRCRDAAQVLEGGPGSMDVLSKCENYKSQMTLTIKVRWLGAGHRLCFYPL